jgi:hypothetical protein
MATYYDVIKAVVGGTAAAAGLIAILEATVGNSAAAVGMAVSTGFNTAAFVFFDSRQKAELVQYASELTAARINLRDNPAGLATKLKEIKARHD